MYLRLSKKIIGPNISLSLPLHEAVSQMINRKSCQLPSPTSNYTSRAVSNFMIGCQKEIVGNQAKKSESILTTNKKELLNNF